MSPYFSKLLSTILDRAVIALRDHTCSRLSKQWEIRGYSRIYHYHIRKTGGKSINFMFLRLLDEDMHKLYKSINIARDRRVIHNGLAVSGWKLDVIQRGQYYFGYSHGSYDEFLLPPNTFTLTCFRDPLNRLLSHYNMLRKYQDKKIPHPCMQREGPWLGNNFDDFLDNIPRAAAMNQLGMFSSKFDIDEALERVKGLSHVMFTESFEQGVKQLNSKTGLSLQPLHTHKTGFHEPIDEILLQKARELLEYEYDFLNRVCYYLKVPSYKIDL